MSAAKWDIEMVEGRECIVVSGPRRAEGEPPQVLAVLAEDVSDEVRCLMPAAPALAEENTRLQSQWKQLTDDMAANSVDGWAAAARRLAAEVERLRAAPNMHCADIIKASGASLAWVDEWKAENTRLQAEVESLREVLRQRATAAGQRSCKCGRFVLSDLVASVRWMPNEAAGAPHELHTGESCGPAPTSDNPPEGKLPAEGKGQ